MYFDCAGSHKLRVAILVPCIFPVNSHVKWLLWHVHVQFDCAGSHKVILMKSSKRSCGDSGDVLSCTGPYYKILCRSCWNPLKSSERSLPAWSCTDPYEKLLWRSCWNPLRSPCGLAQILMRRPCADPSEVLSKRSLRDLEQVLGKRSCGDLGEVLAKRSLHDLVPNLVRRCCGDPVQILPKWSWHYDFEGALHQKCLYGSSSGMLLGSSCMKVW